MSTIELPQFPLGVYEGIDNRTYHARGDIISNTGLGYLLEAPAKFHGRYLDEERHRFKPEFTKATAAQLHGTLAHCAILEPDQFASRFPIGPTVNRATNAWKDFCKAHPDKDCIQEEQRDIAFAQAASVRRDPRIAHILSRGRCELSAYWVDGGQVVDHETGEITERTPVHCRVRPDWVHEANDRQVFLADVKTYASAAPVPFGLQVARQGYDRQAAFYTDGYEHASGKSVEGFVFIAVEQEFPFLCAAYTLPPKWLQRGRVHYRRALAAYRQAVDSSRWVGYTDGVQDLAVPGWVEREVASE